jgi:hypothetical protein
MKNYCNPLNISYKYQHHSGQASREAADPTFILFKGTYYLFASMSAGFYYSEDLIDWSYHENRNLDLYRYAPDVRQVGEYMVFCASDRGKKCAFYRTLDPLSDHFEKVSEPFDFWDPNTFQDDDGKAYLYWGCDNAKPIYGVELDPKDLIPIGEKKELLHGHPYEYGWERFNYPGKEKTAESAIVKFSMFLFNLCKDKNAPYIEGAYMNKWNGKYYLQYAAPATEATVYGDGVYIGDSPLGPFKVQSHNPFSLKPLGFINGAGHGSTIEDKYGNLWHISTMRISANAKYERRVGLFPSGVDEDGILYCNQNFADYPYVIPEGKFDARTLKPEWMLLSYKKPAIASSSREGHGVELAVNENIRNWWCAKGNNEEWYQLDLQDIYQVYGIQINFADEKITPLKKSKKDCSGTIMTNNRYIDSGLDLFTRYLLEVSLDSKEWTVLEDKRKADTDLCCDYLPYENGITVRYLKVTAYELPYNEPFALSGLRVFGKGLGEMPGQVTEVKTEKYDDLSVTVSWKKVMGAMGYNVRLGIAPDKLYTSYLVYDRKEVLITTLNKGQKYYICIDSFNENGITVGSNITYQS